MGIGPRTQVDNLSQNPAYANDDMENLTDSVQENLHIDASRDTQDRVENIEVELSVTESQFEAISRPLKLNEIFRIHAGPGSGKTFTLVARIAQLLSDGVRPEEILVLSMANRSVDSLKETLTKITGSNTAAGVEIATFHSFCAGLLEQYGTMINAGYTKQNIFDEATWKTMIAFFSGKSVKFGEHTIGGTITPVRLSKAISSIMLGTVSVNDVATQHKINPQYVASLVSHLRQSGLIRYDELIADATRLMRYSASRLRENTDTDAYSRYLLPRLANYKAVFVDEFQDVYPSLSSVVRCIVEYPTPGFSGQNKHLTITGDPNQSIYDFLGAHEKDMLYFHTKLPDMDVQDHQLLESFRCTQPILDAAVNVSLKDSDLKLKATRTDAYAQKPILLPARSSIEEYHLVADEIVRLLCSSGGLIHLEDIAILTKTNETAIAMQSVLKTRYGLQSFKLSSGNQWVSSRLHILKHVLGVIAGESGSSVSLMSILLNLDSETGSRKRVSKLFSEGVNKANPGDGLFLESYLFEELSHVGNAKSALATLYKKYPAILERMANFLNQVQKEREILAETHARDPLEYNPAALVSCLKRMASLDGIAQYLESAANETSKATPLEILESFNASVHHAYTKFASKRESQSMTFLDYFLQTYDSEVSNPIGNSIKVSTIHSAKGLEFPIVFILGQTIYSSSWDKILEEETPGKSEQDEMGNSQNGAQDNLGGLPKNTHMQGTNSISRLLYVALTRARNLVYVGHRKPQKELSSITKTMFTSTLPELASAHTAEGGNCNNSGTVYVSPDSENVVDSLAQETAISASDEKSANTPKARELFAMPFLGSLARDVRRPMPPAQNLGHGLDLLDRISRKTKTEIPVSQGKSVFPHKKPKPLYATKRHIPPQITNINRAAHKSFSLTKQALSKRGP